MPGSRGAVLNVGIDDTDSPAGMCTTYLAYRAGGARARRGAEFLDFPRLVRLNPNVPWRTRGNGAVSLRFRTDDPDGARRRVRELVRRHADTGNGANPGLVFLEGEVPRGLAAFAREALCRLVRRGDARRLAERSGIEHEWMGNGQGLVGAIGAVGYEFGDHTLELLSYRRGPRIGTRREVSAESVRRMHEATAPGTFCSYDERRGRPMISPRGPDPVLYGIRGEAVAPLLRAARMVRPGERPDGHMIFRTNQGTGDHLRRRLDPGMPPHSSGTVAGRVCAAPEVSRGGHVSFEVESGGSRFRCAVYRPTGMSRAAALLAPGDRVRVGGGVRRATALHPRALNLEFIRVLGLAARVAVSNPPCPACRKNMKSKGRGQGFECARCGRRARSKVRAPARSGLQRRLYLPDDSALRHLARPAQRAGRSNSARFGAPGWFRVYQR